MVFFKLKGKRDHFTPISPLRPVLFLREIKSTLKLTIYGFTPSGFCLRQLSIVLMRQDMLPRGED